VLKHFLISLAGVIILKPYFWLLEEFNLYTSFLSYFITLSIISIYK